MTLSLSDLFDSAHPFIIRGSANSEVHIYPGYDSSYVENYARGICVQSAIYFHEPFQAAGTFPFYSFQHYSVVDYMMTPPNILSSNKMYIQPKQGKCQCSKRECKECTPTFL